MGEKGLGKKMMPQPERQLKLRLSWKKFPPISILLDKDGHVTKTLSFLEKIRCTSPHCKTSSPRWRSHEPDCLSEIFSLLTLFMSGTTSISQTFKKRSKESWAIFLNLLKHLKYNAQTRDFIFPLEKTESIEFKQRFKALKQAVRRCFLIHS